MAIYHQAKAFGISWRSFFGAAGEETAGGRKLAEMSRCFIQALLAYVTLLVCAGLTLLAAYLDKSSFADVVLLPSEGVEWFRFMVGVLAYITGYFGIYFAPGLVMMRALRISHPNGVAKTLAAFTLSLIGLALAWILTMTVATGEGNRASFYLTVAIFEAVIIVVAWARNRGTSGNTQPFSWLDVAQGGGRDLVIPAIGVFLMIVVGCILMPGKISIESLEGDATEVHGFAASLFHGGLPQWDLEVGVWGFYPTFMFVSYPVFFSLALGGISEAALRLPALLFLGILVLAMADLAGRKEGKETSAALGLLLPVLVTAYLSLQVGAYYANYDPLHGDLAAAPIVEWLVTALAMSAVVLIRDGAPGLGAVAAFLSIISFASGLMLVGLLGVAGFLIGTTNERKVLMKWGLVLTGLVAGYAVFVAAYTSAQGTLEPTINEWLSKYFTHRVAVGAESPLTMLRALGWYVLLAGGLPVVGYIMAFLSRDRMAKWLALTGLLWVGFFIFMSPIKNIHYLMPAALIPVVLATRAGPGRKMGYVSGAQAGWAKAIRSAKIAEWRAPAWASLITLSGLVVIFLSWPKPIPPYTADREFGRTTVFLASIEREAVENSAVLYNIVKPLSKWKAGDPWTTGHHTWVRYADRTLQPSRQYDFYVGRAQPPVDGLEEMSRVTLDGGGYAVLWARDGRARLREWETKFFPLKKELSRFNFDLDPSRWD